MVNVKGEGLGVGRIEPDAYYQRELREPSFCPVTALFYLLAIIIHLFAYRKLNSCVRYVGSL